MGVLSLLFGEGIPMELYKLRRAVRKNGRFTSYAPTTTAKQYGDLIDAAARHLFRNNPNLTLKTYDFPEDIDVARLSNPHTSAPTNLLRILNHITYAP